MTQTTLSGPSVKPASGSEAKQLVLFLHGLGADGHDLIGLAGEIAPHLPDAAFISPHAPFPCDMAPFGHQWFSLQDRAPAKLLAGVQMAAPILNAYIDAQLSHYQLSDDKLAIIGFSQGTMTALYTLPRRAKPCAGIVGFSGAMIGGEQLAAEAKSKPPACLIHGQMDTVVPFEAMQLASKALEAAGITHETHARPNLAHGIDPDGLEAAIAFLKKCF